MDRRNRRFVYDYLTTLLDLYWDWILIWLTLTFVLSWLIFATIWFGIMKIHGDFEKRDRAFVRRWSDNIYSMLTFID